MAVDSDAVWRHDVWPKKILELDGKDAGQQTKVLNPTELTPYLFMKGHALRCRRSNGPFSLDANRWS